MVPFEIVGKIGKFKEDWCHGWLMHGKMESFLVDVIWHCPNKSGLFIHLSLESSLETNFDCGFDKEDRMNFGEWSIYVQSCFSFCFILLIVINNTVLCMNVLLGRMQNHQTGFDQIQ